MSDGGRNLRVGAENIAVRLEWKSDDLLLVAYPWPAQVLARKEQVGPVRIEYRPFGFL